MPNNQKVLWKDGMFLEPHHFRLSEEFQTAHTDARVSPLSYAGFQHGFTELEIDRDALLGGSFSIVRCAGVFPDGGAFRVGFGSSAGAGADALPLSRSFAGHCRHEQMSLEVYLAIPAFGVAAACTDGGGGYTGAPAASRYIEKSVLVPDELLPDNGKEIDIGVPNFQIRFEGESLDGCVWLLAARLSRSGAGYMELEGGHAPAVLFTRSSAVLRGCIGGLLELLWAKIGSLAQCRRQTEMGQAFFSASEIHPFWLLNTLCMFTPLLGRLHEQPKVHPFEFYTLLTSLCGGLLSFSPRISPDGFPPYDHDDPAASFFALAGRVRESLDVEFWTSTAALALERVNPTTWTCRFPSAGFARSVNLFVGVKADAPQTPLILNVLQRMKVCSRDKLDMLISSSMPGLPLIHVKNIPEGLAAKPDCQYFIVDRQGQHWPGVEASGTLGIHFPSGYREGEVELELLALKHNE